MAEHDAGDRYSYFYRGSNQSLDNILVSKNIKDKVVFSPVHINASFMEEHGRASDHDPVVVQIDFSKPKQSTTPEVKPTLPELSGESDNSNKEKTNRSKDEKTILPKTGLTSSSSLVFVTLGVIVAFFLVRKKRNN